VIGGGPAGSAAAITAVQCGASTVLYEQSRFPRHKVCGEYLSPEIVPLLAGLGVLDGVTAANPHRLVALKLHFPRNSKTVRLPESAWGFSRYALDALLLGRVADVRQERRAPAGGDVVATGRRASNVPRGNREFGFKAHFRGPKTDTIELFFFDGCYTGVNGIEDGLTNVCGLGPESVLARYGFQPDELIRAFPALCERVAPLERVMDWHTTGPLAYVQRDSPERYLAGDALSFIDPFTGSGILSALISGMSAGRSAALGEPPGKHYRRCERALRRPFLVSSLIRASIRSGLADLALPLVPGSWLVRWTRPRASVVD